MKLPKLIKNTSVLSVLLCCLALSYCFNILYLNAQAKPIAKKVAPKKVAPKVSKPQAISNNVFLNQASQDIDNAKYDSALQNLEQAKASCANNYMLYYLYGCAYCGQYKFKLALPQLQKALSLNQSDPNVYNKLGYALYKSGQGPKAIAILTKGIALAQNNKSQLLNLYNTRSDAYSAIDKFDLGLKDAQAAILLAPKNAQAYYNRGWAYRHLHQISKGVADFNKALELNPNYSYAYYGLSNIYQIDADYPKAIEYGNKAISLDPNNSDFYHTLGINYQLNGDDKKAIDIFSKEIQLNPSEAQGYYRRGESYQNLSQYSLAIADLNKAIELDPNNPRCYMFRGQYYREVSDYDSAIADLNRAISLDPYDKQFYCNLGYVYYANKDYNSAIKQFNRTIELDNFYVQALSGKTGCYIKLKNYAKAHADIAKALAITPKDVKLYCTQAWLYSQEKKYNEAIAACQRGLAFNPNYSWLYTQMGGYEGLMGNNLAYYELANKAYEVNPDKSDGLFEIADFFFDMQDFEMALKFDKKALAINSENQNAIYNSISSYFNIEKPVEALECIEKLMQKFPTKKKYCNYYIYFAKTLQNVNDTQAYEIASAGARHLDLALGQFYFENFSESLKEFLKITDSPDITVAAALVKKFGSKDQIAKLKTSDNLYKPVYNYFVESAGLNDMYNNAKMFPDIMLSHFALAVNDIVNHKTNQAYCEFKWLSEFCLNYSDFKLLSDSILKYHKLGLDKIANTERAALQAIREQSTNYTAYLVLAKYYFDCQKYNKTVEYCQKAVKLNSTDFNISRLMGKALIAQKKYEEGIAQIEQSNHVFDNEVVDEVFQKVPKDYVDIALAYQEMHQDDRALDYLNKAYAANPGNIQVIDELAKAYSAKNDNLNASKYYFILSSIEEDNPNYLYQSGAHLFLLGDFKSACVPLKHLFDLTQGVTNLSPFIKTLATSGSKILTLSSILSGDFTNSKKYSEAFPAHASQLTGLGYYCTGIAAQLLQKYQIAVSCFEKASKSDENYLFDHSNVLINSNYLGIIASNFDNNNKEATKHFIEKASAEAQTDIDRDILDYLTQKTKAQQLMDKYGQTPSNSTIALIISLNEFSHKHYQEAEQGFGATMSCSQQGSFQFGLATLENMALKDKSNNVNLNNTNAYSPNQPITGSVSTYGNNAVQTNSPYNNNMVQGHNAPYPTPTGNGIYSPTGATVRRFASGLLSPLGGVGSMINQRMCSGFYAAPSAAPSYIYRSLQNSSRYLGGAMNNSVNSQYPYSNANAYSSNNQSNSNSQYPYSNANSYSSNNQNNSNSQDSFRNQLLSRSRTNGNQKPTQNASTIMYDTISKQLAILDASSDPRDKAAAADLRAHLPKVFSNSTSSASTTYPNGGNVSNANDNSTSGISSLYTYKGNTYGNSATSTSTLYPSTGNTYGNSATSTSTLYPSTGNTYGNSAPSTSTLYPSTGNTYGNSAPSTSTLYPPTGNTYGNSAPSTSTNNIYGASSNSKTNSNNPYSHSNNPYLNPDPYSSLRNKPF